MKENSGNGVRVGAFNAYLEVVSVEKAYLHVFVFFGTAVLGCQYPVIHSFRLQYLAMLPRFRYHRLVGPKWVVSGGGMERCRSSSGRTLTYFNWA
jgi:hypothetical protein